MRWLVALVLALVASGACAYGEVPSTMAKTYSMRCAGSTVFTGSSAGAVLGQCQASLSVTTGGSTGTGCSFNVTYTYTLLFVSETTSGTSGTFDYSQKRTGSRVGTSPPGCNAGSDLPVDYGVSSGAWVSAPGCPDHALFGSGSDAAKCFCDASHKAGADGKCADVGFCNAVVGGLNALNDPLKSSGGAGSLKACYGGCEITSDFGGQGSDGSFWLFPGYKATGNNCQGGQGSGDTIEPAPIKCAQNKCPGTVNGQNVCVACSVSQNTGSSSSSGGASSPSSGASGSSSSIDGVPGAVSKDSTVTCDGSNCTTTTTYRDGSGTTVGTKTDTKDQSSFCEENPGLAICKNSQISASCSSFSCDGDAVQCAIAQQAFKSKCDWDKVDQSIVNAGNSAMSGGDQPAGHPGANPSVITLGAGTLDMSERLGGGCPSDYSFSVGGHGYVIPFSQQCGNLNLIGQCMVAVCLLAAVMIVFRGNS